MAVQWQGRNDRQHPAGRPGGPRGRFGQRLLLPLLLLLVCGLASAQPIDRWIPLQGAANFREAGGYYAGPTSAVAAGRIFRSDALAWLTTSDTAVIRALGVRTILDLRNTEQVAAYPDAAGLDAFTSHVYAPIIALFPYTQMLTSYSLQWKTAFDALADPDRYPVLYHCQAGRDRTGVMSAMLLKLLGVDRQTIISDYMLSNLIYPTIYPSYIEAVLDTIDNAGGIDAYLESIGVTAATRAAIRANLLVSRLANVRFWTHY